MTSTYSQYETLRVHREGLVGWLIFNRPERLNAMNGLMQQELATAWRELDEDPEVRVIINTGEGRAFQTGIDVGELAGDPEGMARYKEATVDFDLHFTAWHAKVGKPVIAAVNGHCVGGGFHFVGDADIVIASAKATFSDPHVSVGQATVFEPIGLLPRLPFEAVMRMALLGRHERMSAQRAYELGLVSQVVEADEDVRVAATKLAELIAKNSPAAMKATKKALWGALEVGLTDGYKQGIRYLTGLWGHPDTEEGPRAFMEKRDPVWAE